MTDNVYKFLNAPHRKRMEIRRKEKVIEELRFSLLPRAIQYDADKVQSSPEDQLSKMMARISELEDDIKRLKVEHSKLIIKVSNEIEKLDDDIQKIVLIEWYINKTHIQNIMKDVGCSERSVYRHKREGVKKLRQIINNWQ